MRVCAYVLLMNPGFFDEHTYVCIRGYVTQLIKVIKLKQFPNLNLIILINPIKKGPNSTPHRFM